MNIWIQSYLFVNSYSSGLFSRFYSNLISACFSLFSSSDDQIQMFHELLVKSEWLLTNLTLTAQKQYIYMLAQLCPVVAIICSGYGILSYYVPVQLTSVLTVTTNIACLLTNFLLHLLHHRSQSLVLIISYIFCFCLRMYNDRSFLFGLESDSRYGLSAASPKTVLSVTIPVTECFLTALSGLE